MIKEIITDEIELSKICIPISMGSSANEISLRDRIKIDLLHTVVHYNGAGLAANQIGHPYTVMVIHILEELKVLFNPELIIIRDSKRTQALEGCLSRPGKKPIKVKRYKMIKIRIYGQDKLIKLRGWESRTAQHEFDHFNGFLI